MDSNKAFNDFKIFFNGCPANEGTYTHTIIAQDHRCPLSGKAMIPHDKHDDFVKAYCDVVMHSDLKFAVVERRDGLDHAFILVDVDIEGIVAEGSTRVYGPNHIAAFAQALSQSIKAFVKCDGDFNVVIAEKRQGTELLKKKSKVTCLKDGWHAYVPEVFTTREVQFAIRRHMLQQMPHIMDGIEPLNDKGWDDVLDDRVIDQNGIVLVGSRKPKGYHYDVTRIFTYAKFRLVSEAVLGFPSGRETGYIRVAHLQRFDLFQRSAFRKQAMQPTEECLGEMEIYEATKKATSAKSGRPSKEDVMIRDVPIELPDIPDEIATSIPPLTLVKRAVKVVAKHEGDGYDSWYKMAFSLISLLTGTNREEVLEMFLMFSQASPKFNKAESTKKFFKLVDSWRSNYSRKKRTWRSLFSRLYEIKKESPGHADECQRILSALKGYQHLQKHCDIQTALPWSVVEEYTEEKCFPFYTKGVSKDNTLVAVQSCMGSGKTYQIEELLLEQLNASYLMISTRRSYARNVVFRLRNKDIEIDLYLDAADPSSSKKLMISFESFFRVGQHYDIVILDELTAISAQILSDTVNRLPDCYAIFSKVIASAKQVICLDAMLTRPSLQFIRRLAPHHEARLYVNSAQRLPRTYEVTFAKLPERKPKVNIQTFLMFEGIAADLRDGKVLKFGTASKRVGDQLLRHLQIFHADLYGSLCNHILFISSDTPGKELANFIDNMHDVLKTKRLLIHTSTMSVGVDYSEPNVFDKSIMYGVAASGQTGVDLLQQDMRVRHINDTVVRVFYSQAICSYLPMTTEAVQKDCARKKTSMNMLFEQRRKERAVAAFKELRDMLATGDATMDYVKALVEDVNSTDDMEDVPAALRELHEAHTIDQSHWAAHYGPMFEETVKRMGHKYQERRVDLSEMVSSNGMPFSEMLQIANPAIYMDDDDVLNLYDSIETVTPDGYELLRKIQKAGNADADTNLKIKKFIFDRHLDRFPREIQQRITHEKRCKIFYLQKTDKQIQKIFLQMATEFCDSNELLNNIADYRPYAIQVKAAEACLPHIRRICSILGLLHTLDTHPTVSRSAIENNMDDLDHQCKQVIRLLKIRDGRTKETEINFNLILQTLGNVLGNWCGMHLCDISSDQKQATTHLKLCVKDVKAAGISAVIF